MHLTKKRSAKIDQVAKQRQTDLTVVLENVHDPHNISAVLRTCDAVGIPEIYLLVTDERVNDRIELGKRASAGARKWVDVHVFRDVNHCFKKIKSKYSNLIGTHLGSNSQSLYEVDFTGSTAIVLGNEHDGLSSETLQHLDANIIIPQFGMVQSLNISVACAVTLYEAARQRIKRGLYAKDEFNAYSVAIRNEYLQRHIHKHKGNKLFFEGD